MASVLYAGGAEEAQTQGLGLSGIFNRKKPRGASSVFEAEQQQAEDALDAFQAVPASRGGVLSHRGQPAGASQAAAAEVEAATASAAEADDEARRLQAQCEQQAAELAAVREQARRSEREARCTLNLQRFKYELLLDLWCMRVLDNEELGLQADTAAASARGRA